MTSNQEVLSDVRGAQRIITAVINQIDVIHDKLLGGLHSGVHHILCCVFVCLRPVSCVPYAASFSGLFIFECPFGIL
jgi:hypothetical protein